MFNFVIVFILYVITPLIQGQEQRSIVVIKKFNLHKYNIENQWSYIQNMFKKGPIQQLAIVNSVIQLQGLKKIFQYNLTKLKVLNITNSILNPKVTQFLFEQDIIYEVQELILQQTNIHCEDLSVLKQKQSKIKKLSLANNFVSSKGFEYLSRVKMNLQSINLYQNSLLYSKSVDALISMNLSNIQSINLGVTSISSRNLLRVLNSLDKQKLVNLTIRRNIYSQQFYREFTQMKFPKLEYLDLYSLIIQDNTWKYFLNFTLPECKVLNLHQNQITTEMAIELITIKNFPKLQVLDLNLNFINSSFIAHLRKEGFIFRELKFRIPATMDKNGLVQLSKMNLSNLQYFDYSISTTEPQILKQFFYKSDLRNLKQIHMPILANATNFLQVLLNSDLSNAQQIKIPDAGDFNVSLLQKSNVFPKLKKFQIKFVSTNPQLERKILQNIQVLAPELQQFIFALSQPGPLLFSIINQQINYKLNKKLKICLYTAGHQLQPISRFFQVIVAPNSKPKIIFMINVNVYSKLLQHKLRKGQIKSKLELLDSSVNKFAKQIIQNKFKNFDFTELLQFYPQSNYYFLEWYQRNSHNKCIFKNLTTANFRNLSDHNLNIIKNCSYPNLLVVQLDFSLQFIHDDVQKQQQQESQKKDQLQNKKYKQSRVNISIPQFPYIHSLFISQVNNISLMKILQEGKFQYLKALTIQEMKLLPENMSQIIKKIPYFNRIKTIDISDNYFNSNLTFLRDSDLRFKIFVMDNIILSSEKELWKDLCAMNYQFLTIFSLQRVGLDDKFIQNFIQCLQDKNVENEVLFPKLKNLIMKDNYLEKNGISSIMKLNLTLIEDISFQNNKDPQYFNTVFHQKSSKRLMSFSSYGNYFSGIDSNTENITSHTNRILDFILMTDQLRGADITFLSEFNFPSLISLGLKLKRVDSCQNLKDIHKMSYNLHSIRLIFDQPYGLNSSCITEGTQSTKLPYQVIISADGPYAQVKNFAQFYFGEGQDLTKLTLSSTYVSNQKLKSTFSSIKNSKLSQIVIIYNNLTDEPIIQLFKQQQILLQRLMLTANQFITSQCFKYMNNYNFPSLQILVLDQTSFGDEGIRYLTRNQFPNLMYLSLSNVNITTKSIQNLNKLKAPTLRLLDLSCNQLTADDIARLQVKNFPLLTMLVIYPSLSQQQYIRLNLKFNQNPFNTKPDEKKSKIIIQTDIQYGNIQNYLQAE